MNLDYDRRMQFCGLTSRAAEEAALLMRILRQQLTGIYAKAPAMHTKVVRDM